LLYDVKQAMEILCVSAHTLANLIHNEGLPAFRLGGEVKFQAEELRNWASLRAEKESLSGADFNELLALIDTSEGEAEERMAKPPDPREAELLLSKVAIPDRPSATAAPPQPQMELDEIELLSVPDESDEEEPESYCSILESAPEEPSILLFGAFSMKFQLFDTLIMLEPGPERDERCFEMLALLLEDLEIKVPNFDDLKHTLIKAQGSWVKLKDAANPFQEKVNIKISQDGLRAYMVICALDENDYISMMDVDDELKRTGITENIDRETARRLVSEKLFGRLMMIAEGVAPVPGKDACHDYHFDTEKALTPSVLETGNVDFKNLDNITNVRAGDVLVTKIPATDGENGIDVRGLPIIAPHGKNVRIRVGTNTVLSDDGDRLFAGTDGHVFLRNNIVHVENIYIVDGDVDFSTGNIDFAGIVIVNGFVRQGFEVRAEGNISINGGVEGAIVESRNGDINIRYGVQGQNKALIKAKGKIKAKFINQAKVEADDDVIVSQAVMQSEINSGGSVIAEGQRGRIIGGKIRAADTIIARSIGSESHTKTYLYLEKMDPESGDPVRNVLFKQKNNVEQELKKCMSNIELMRKRIAKNKPDTGLLQTIKATANRAKELNGILKQLTAEIEKFNADFGPVGNRFIRARGIIYPQVYLNIENRKLRIDKEYKVATFCCDRERENEIICKEQNL